MSSAVASGSAQAARSELATPELFDRWAEVYDHQVNPFLSLEQRVVSALLPTLRGRDVLDAGCGTGRWLKQLAAQHPRQLTGVDSSPAMLTHAAPVVADLHCAPCTELPLQDASVDVVLSSFVLSYIEDHELFAQELARVVRVGGSVILSDLHPDTTRKLNWQRTFPSADGDVTIATQDWCIEDLILLFEERGFSLTAEVDVPFGPPEHEIFTRANKRDVLAELQQHPAVCVLQFTREIESIAPSLTLGSARVALSPHEAVVTSIAIADQRIASFTPSQNTNELDLTGYLVLPGLINAHDHLEFGLFPRLGHGPYANSRHWAEDIHTRDHELIALHRSIPREARVQWGAIRNLLCGVTTVCHHNPIRPEMLAPDFPVAVVEDFSWAHSLAIEPEIAEKSYATDRPFIVHAAEGVDASAVAELRRLDDMNLIRDNTILVHGLAFSREDALLLNKRGAALITCPSSNQFLFLHTPSPETLRLVCRLAIGSDSPLTAVGDLLDEVRFAQAHLGLEEELLYTSVTASAAEMLGLPHKIGRLFASGPADLIAIKDRGHAPAATLSRMTAADVELVVRRGRVFLASDTIYRRLSDDLCQEMEPILVDGEPRWLRAPLRHLFQQAAPLLEDGALHLAGKEVRYGHGNKHARSA